MQLQNLYESASVWSHLLIAHGWSILGGVAYFSETFSFFFFEICKWNTEMKVGEAAHNLMQLAG